MDCAHFSFQYERDNSILVLVVKRINSATVSRFPSLEPTRRKFMQLTWLWETHKVTNCYQNHSIQKIAKGIHVQLVLTQRRHFLSFSHYTQCYSQEGLGVKPDTICIPALVQSSLRYPFYDETTPILYVSGLSAASIHITCLSKYNWPKMHSFPQSKITLDEKTLPASTVSAHLSTFFDTNISRPSYRL